MNQLLLFTGIFLIAFIANGQINTDSNIFINYTETTTGVNINMVAIKGGTFTMGSPKSEHEREKDETQHTVTLSDFYIGETEVTFDQYDAFCDSTSRKKPDDEGWGRGTRPVINVSWDDATAYCIWLSEKSGKSYRLPTEAEWEYACRAGTSTPFNTGNNLSTAQANYDGNFPYNGNEDGKYRKKTLPVGSYPSNAFGLHDMHGNVCEWCADYSEYNAVLITDTYYNGVVNPLCKIGSNRVCRGGGWEDFAQDCRSACRCDFGAKNFDKDLGFRLVYSR